VETRNAFYPKGFEVDLPDYVIDALLLNGVVKVLHGTVHDSEPQFEKADVPQPEPEPVPQPRFKRGRK
jgi:uncharacterized metal-binding protein YceD (DUF177 family)